MQILTNPKLLSYQPETKFKVNPDLQPGIRAAGYKKPFVWDKENADFNVRPDIHAETLPATPEGIKKFRKSHITQPGTIYRHYGTAGDPMRFSADFRYGMQSLSSEKVGDVMQYQTLSGMAEKFNAIKEARYHSRIKEPLARSLNRSYVWPK